MAKVIGKTVERQEATFEHIDSIKVDKSSYATCVDISTGTYIVSSGNTVGVNDVDKLIENCQVLVADGIIKHVAKLSRFRFSLVFPKDTDVDTQRLVLIKLGIPVLKVQKAVKLDSADTMDASGYDFYNLPIPYLKLDTAPPTLGNPLYGETKSANGFADKVNPVKREAICDELIDAIPVAIETLMSQKLDRIYSPRLDTANIYMVTVRALLRDSDTADTLRELSLTTQELSRMAADKALLQRDLSDALTYGNKDVINAMQIELSQMSVEIDKLRSVKETLRGKIKRIGAAKLAEIDKSNTELLDKLKASNASKKSNYRTNTVNKDFENLTDAIRKAIGRADAVKAAKLAAEREAVKSYRDSCKAKGEVFDRKQAVKLAPTFAGKK
jgi:hypothetical protein